jgi:hypothetical protein
LVESADFAAQVTTTSEPTAATEAPLFAAPATPRRTGPAMPEAPASARRRRPGAATTAARRSGFAARLAIRR